MSDIPVGSPPAPPGRHAAPTRLVPGPGKLGPGALLGRLAVVPQYSPQSRLAGRRLWPGSVRALPAPNVTRPPAYAAPRMGSVQATMTADGVPLASWWWRVLAVLIDNLITTAIVTVITFPVWRSLYASLVSYFNAVLDAQQSGVDPPTLNATI